MTLWTWAGASCRGSSHVKAGTRRQDAFASFAVRDGAVLVAIVSDGAGSASHGGEGASLICRTLSLAARAHFSASACLPADEEVRRWIDDARDRIGIAAARRGLVPRDFAATLVLAITDGRATMVAHVGDGSAVVREEDGASWRALSWPAQGEYASTTFFVTDDPQPQLRFARTDDPVDAVAIFSDGIERLVLDYAEESAHQPFFRGIILPLEAAPSPGLDADLSAKLRDYLDGPAITERTDDDKTLVLAVRR